MTRPEPLPVPWRYRYLNSRKAYRTPRLLLGKLLRNLLLIGYGRYGLLLRNLLLVGYGRVW